MDISSHDTSAGVKEKGGKIEINVKKEFGGRLREGFGREV